MDAALEDKSEIDEADFSSPQENSIHSSPISIYKVCISLEAEA